MTLADRTISALANEHAALGGIAASLSDDQLAGPSGTSEWALHQVFSHLGSGAEITLAGLQAALGGDAPAEDFNQTVWDRWNAMPAREQLEGFLAHDAALVEALETLDAEQRESLQVKIGFLPFPLSVASFAGMRLGEVALHSWDVRVALDTDAGVADESAQVLIEQYSSGLGFLLGFVGKPDNLASPSTVDIHGYGLTIADSVSLTPAVADATATFTGPLEAAVRLLGGRLAAARTPADVSVTGNVTLDDLRRVFPGY
ncbi:MAG: hypothetical protein JWN20_286 [Jatrophihabitantaceae bacterium]|nr:hypothetical protein [Jatrophihabitantaceae bacterium]